MGIGKVFLVGAGPGDPGLLTLKARRCLENADVVLYDRLVHHRILEFAPKTASLENVGKTPGDHKNTQNHINTLMVNFALQGKTVIRLHGGDPFVFGRGGEEADHLQRAKIPFEIVSGVTSVVAVPAYAGIPLTYRGVSSSFTVVTGSEDPNKKESSIHWRNLAKLQGTLVILMGWRNLPSIIELLIANGKSTQTPVALVMFGTRSNQTVVTGTLSNIVKRGESNHISPPVVILIGEVQQFRETLNWFDNHTLFGKRILVTRASAQAGTLARLLESHGAVPVEVPTIAIRPLCDYSILDNNIQNLSDYDWIVFSSANAVDAVFKRLSAKKMDSRSFANVQVACIGPSSARALRSRGINANLVPKTAVSESLLDAFASIDLNNKNVLLPKADIGRNVLSKGLATLGARVNNVVVYQTIKPESSKHLVENALAQGVDVVVFTSSSTVENFARLLGGSLESLKNVKVACIGPITATTVEASGLSVDITANEHTIDGLVRAIESYFSVGGHLQ